MPTIVAELAVVNVITGMTASAGRRDVVSAGRFAAMAVIARKTCVFAFEREVGVNVVVEHNCGPAIARVAAGAVVAE